MFYKTLITTVAIAWTILSFAQKNNQHTLATYPDSIAPVGIIKNIPDSELLDIVQRQTFRYFWHFGHPVSGLARERDNTVKAVYYWDFINEAEGEPNFSKDSFGPEACAIGGFAVWPPFTTVVDALGVVCRGHHQRTLLM